MFETILLSTMNKKLIKLKAMPLFCSTSDATSKYNVLWSGLYTAHNLLSTNAEVCKTHRTTILHSSNETSVSYQETTTDLPALTM